MPEHDDDAPFADEEPKPVLDPSKDLPGAVLMLPNRDWDIKSVTSDDHPGACAAYLDHLRDAILVKGTDADNLRSYKGYFLVSPTDDNGLSKLTAFRLLPRYFRLHRIRLFFPERHLGWLDDGTLLSLCDELARVHPEE